MVVLRAVGDVVDLELYCGALLNGWLHRRATLAVSILEQLEIHLLLFNSTSVCVHRTLYLTTVSSPVASHARCWKRTFRANGMAKSNDLANSVGGIRSNERSCSPLWKESLRHAPPSAT